MAAKAGDRDYDTTNTWQSQHGVEITSTWYKRREIRK